MTPLHYATMGGHAETCQLLINHGVNVDTVNTVTMSLTIISQYYIVYRMG